MDRAAAVAWLEDYKHAWETYSPEASGNLFTKDAVYSFHPYDPPMVGRQAIVEAWLKDPAPPDAYEATYKLIALDGDVAAVNGRSRYFKDSSRSELTKEWDHIFAIEFAQDGRCGSFREWYVAPPGQTD